MDEYLRGAIQQADLPALIDEHFPKARSGVRVRCLWRDGRGINAQLYRWNRDQRWRMRDYVSGLDVDAYGFLVDVIGRSKSDAARELLRRAGGSRPSGTSHANRTRVPSPPPLPSDLALPLAGRAPWSEDSLIALCVWLERRWGEQQSSLPPSESSKSGGGALLDGLLSRARAIGGIHASNPMSSSANDEPDDQKKP